MSPSQFQVRRATLDDLSQLTALWGSMHLTIEDRAKRITDFQVAVDAEGCLVGTVGLQIAERQGRVHSEAFGDFAWADQIRPLLWERIQAVALNHGLLRLWTQEQAPFWSHCGMVPAEPDALQKLPQAWRGRASSWLTLKLREDLDVVIAADQEFAMFMEAERQRTQRTLKQAKLFKVFATLLALAVVGLALGAVLFLVLKNPRLVGR